jgi:hypothetical protein
VVNYLFLGLLNVIFYIVNVCHECLKVRLDENNEKGIEANKETRYFLAKYW